MVLLLYVRRLTSVLAALNWPDHRGSATAFPLAAFGLSAFFFVTISSLAFPDNTSDFLLLLAAGTFCMAFVPLFFLRVIPHTRPYARLPSDERRGRSNSHSLTRTKSGESRYSAEYSAHEPGRPTAVTSSPRTDMHRDKSPEVSHVNPSDGRDETSSLVPRSSTASIGHVCCQENGRSEGDTVPDSHHLDIRGMALLHRVEFWQLFSLLGLLTGIGLMTIK